MSKAGLVCRHHCKTCLGGSQGSNKNLNFLKLYKLPLKLASTEKYEEGIKNIFNINLCFGILYLKS